MYISSILKYFEVFDLSWLFTCRMVSCQGRSGWLSFAAAEARRRFSEANEDPEARQRRAEREAAQAEARERRREEEEKQKRREENLKHI